MILFSINSAGWLEPLLGRIAEDKRHVVAPVIGNINDDTLQFAWFNPDQIHVGKFDWDLTFNWMPIPSYVKDKMNSKVDPIRLVSDFNGFFFCRVFFFSCLKGAHSGLLVIFPLLAAFYRAMTPLTQNLFAICKIMPATQNLC